MAIWLYDYTQISIWLLCNKAFRQFRQKRSQVAHFLKHHFYKLCLSLTEPLQTQRTWCNRNHTNFEQASGIWGKIIPSYCIIGFFSSLHPGARAQCQGLFYFELKLASIKQWILWIGRVEREKNPVTLFAVTCCTGLLWPGYLSWGFRQTVHRCGCSFLLLWFLTWYIRLQNNTQAKD